MSGKKIIAVVGATGNQGSSVAKTFLALTNWHVRCLTRNPSSNAGKDLANQGAEVVQANLDEPASLAAAFQGAHAIFLNTDFWATWKPAVGSGTKPEVATKQATEVETTHGKNAVDEASKIPTLERFVYSTLPPLSKASGGKYWRSGHWEAKAWIVDYIERQHPELHSKTSLIVLGAYRDTNAYLVPKLHAESGKYVFALPLKESTSMPVIDAPGSTGPFVRCLIEDEPPQTKLLAYDTDSNPTLGELVAMWSKASGKEAIYQHLTIEDVIKAGASHEHADAAAYVDEFGYKFGLDGILEPPELKYPPRTVSLQEWLNGRDWNAVLKA